MKSLKFYTMSILVSLSIFGTTSLFSAPQVFAASENTGKKTIHEAAKLTGNEMHGKKPDGKATFRLHRGESNKRMLTIHVNDVHFNRDNNSSRKVKISGCGDNDIGSFRIRNGKGRFDISGGPICFPHDKIKIMESGHTILSGKFSMHKSK